MSSSTCPIRDRSELLHAVKPSAWTNVWSRAIPPCTPDVYSLSTRSTIANFVGALLLLGRGEDDLEYCTVTTGGIARSHRALSQIRRRGATLSIADRAGRDLELRLGQDALRAYLHRRRGEDVTTGFALGVRLALRDVHIVLRLKTCPRHGDGLVIREPGLTV